MISFIHQINDNKELIIELIRKELKILHKGSILGMFWLFFLPLFQTLMYVFLISFLINFKFNTNYTIYEHSLYVLGGIIPWQIISSSIQKSPMIIREKVEYIKQVIFPIRTLPIISISVNSFGVIVSFIFFLICSLSFGLLSWSIILLPILLILIFIFLIGIGWIFSVIGIFFKDLKEILTIFFSFIIYLTPVVINQNMVNGFYWNIIMLNPFSHFIVCFRDLYYYQFHFTSWLVLLLISLISFFLGLWLINKTEHIIGQFI
tara:strand:- start:981 stop:1766 length:786 start_codon:yes stop_codon:yes gene_type:complete